MLALDATFNVRSKRGRRSLKAREFFQGPFATALAEDELLLDIVLPPLPKGAGTAYLSQDQAASGYALAGAAAVRGPDAEDGQPRRRRAHRRGRDRARSSPPPTSWSAPRASRRRWPRWPPPSVDGIEVQGDIHAPADYRRHLATVVVRRALELALERAK